MLSIADKVALLPQSDRVAWFRSLPKPVQDEVPRRPWWLVRRPEQKCPEGLWFVWLILSGRGWGSPRTGAETLLEWIIAEPEWDGIPTDWAIFAETKGDAGSICVLGPSGFVRAMEKQGLEGRPGLRLQQVPRHHHAARLVPGPALQGPEDLHTGRPTTRTSVEA